MTPEGLIKSEINAVLAHRGAWMFMPVPTGFQAHSIDYIVCCKGWFIGIEAKAPGKKATGKQEHILSRIRAAGGLTFVVSSKHEVAALDKAIGELHER